MNAMRRLRTLISLIALFAIAGCARAPAPAGTAPPIVGAWRSSVQFTSGSFATIKDLQFLYVFNAGGTMTESSNYDEAPPVPPAYGEWRETATNEFEAKYVFFVTAPPARPDSRAMGSGWSPAGHGVLAERIRIAADHRTYDSTIRLDLFDATGNAASGGGEATAHGVRVEF